VTEGFSSVKRGPGQLLDNSSELEEGDRMGFSLSPPQITRRSKSARSAGIHRFPCGCSASHSRVPEMISVTTMAAKTAHTSNEAQIRQLIANRSVLFALKTMNQIMSR